MARNTCAFRARATMTSIGARSCLALGIAGVVLVFLIMLMLLRLLVGPDPTITDDDLALKIVNHPQWPAMEDDLSLMLGRAKEDRITSFYKSDSQSDISQQIDHYLYRAILYAAVLRAKYKGTTSFTEKVVRGHAKAYLQGMLRRTRNGALPALQVASTQDMSEAMSQHLYSTIVQAQVLVTMHSAPKNVTELEQDIKDLKAQIASMTIQIEDVALLKIQIEEKQNCCELANRCKQHVEELGGSVDYFGDYVKKTKYSFEFEHKELSARQAVEHGHQKMKELGVSVGDDGWNKVDDGLIY
ncbi:hypothetical protein PVAP13_4NG207700 [Panicum virgatum]|uniref:Uncharacterized protein n=1 Tax=Panicum virgatum TaxID=38727 RepID=A0A8T0T3Y1_PANVG|nr:hypothetical protein PVAP13_4NG207700 [Panicum virgatum]